METPDKCKFCGSPPFDDMVEEYSLNPEKYPRQYSCFTMEYAKDRFEREEDCYQNQISQLKAKITQLEARAEAAGKCEYCGKSLRCQLCDADWSS